MLMQARDYYWDNAQGATLQLRDAWRARNRGRFVQRGTDVVLKAMYGSSRVQRRLARKAASKKETV